MREKLSIYVHIPFCVRKCLYCDFLSFNADNELIESYFFALGKELSMEARDYRDYEVISVFIGGGTPSFVDSQYIVKLMAMVKELFNVREDAEITIEANPASALYKKLVDYRKAGINRLSIGAQSLDDDELKKLGRVHDSRMFYETFENARKAGFDNVNIDVMSALPGQSLESYLDTLRKVTDLRPEHISAYSLIVEEGTPFFDMELNLPDEDTDRRMYHETLRHLSECGYHRYEISNYALSRLEKTVNGNNMLPVSAEHIEDGSGNSYITGHGSRSYECRHNKVYWRRGNYLGVGIGAASMVDNMRWNNTRDIKEYIAAMAPVRRIESVMHNEGSSGGIESVRQNVESLDVDSQMEEFMFLGLRMTEGVSTGRFRELYGREIEDVYGDVITKYEKLNLLERFGQNLRLTEKGLDVSNTVMADFLL